MSVSEGMSWGYSESPLVDGKLLICSPGGEAGTVVALDKMTGAVVWRCKELTHMAAYSSPVAADIQGLAIRPGQLRQRRRRRAI